MAPATFVDMFKNKPESLERQLNVTFKGVDCTDGANNLACMCYTEAIQAVEAKVITLRALLLKLASAAGLCKR